MTPFYERDGISIFCGDCLEVMPQLDTVFDAVVTDPPYGMNWNPDSMRFSGGNRRRGCGRDWDEIINDDQAFDPTPFLSFPRIVLWGYNHFAGRLPVGTTLVWIKKADHLFGTFLSDAELAWMKGGHGVYCYQKSFPPPLRMIEGNGKVLHPNQKPVALMQWCIEKAKVPRDGIILDPFMGSGTTLVAAQQLGRHAVGIEISLNYCKIAVERLRQRSLWQIAPVEAQVEVEQGEMEL